jgi:transcriptional regulator with GAF, ATPase, and Fis domain
VRPSPSWIRGWRVDELTLEAVRASIGALWATPERYDRQLATYPGVLVFAEFHPELVEQVQSLAADGGRILALSAGGAASREGMLALLSAGAAAVMFWTNATEAAANVVARLQRWAAVDAATERVRARYPIVGQGKAWTAFIRRLSEAAMFSSAPILLLGESGTGKERLARWVHMLSERPGECVVVDCSTLEPNLSGSELFGHEKGSYTGAVGEREGAFLLAHRGTLFLDEVGELPARLQAQLLRVSQERTYKRLGSNHWFESDFRLVSATHRDLHREVTEQRFRFDFLQRIGTWTLRVPPLRERPDDILPLARHFARRLLGERFAGMSPLLEEALIARNYPGNVRELEQLVLRLCCQHVGDGPLCLSDLASGDLPDAGAAALSHVREAIEQSASRAVLSQLGLREVLRQARGAAIGAALGASQQNVRDAARLLGITDRALQMELAKR